MSNILKLTDMSIQFGGLKAIDSLGLEVNKGEIVAIIGPNGAGKTTAFNCITGIYRPTSGNIEYLGKSIIKEEPEDITKRGIARTFQNIRLFNKLSVHDNVKIALQNKYRYSTISGIFRLGRYKRYEALMDEEALALLKVFNLENEAAMKSANLPYGKQRKLEIARAIATNPKVLLLDEPAAGMNENETKELMNSIRLVKDKFNMTILLIEHDMKLVKGICEELTVLNFGKVLAQGPTEEVLKNKDVIKAYLGE